MDIGLIGFGGVGQAFVKLIYDKRDYLKKKYNLSINLKYIIKSDGGIYNSEGINIEKLLQYLDKGKDIQKYKNWRDSINIDTIIKNNDIETLVELTSTNIETGQPGLMHIKEALVSKINVVTGNKGPILLEYKKLKEIADLNNVSLMVGCTTGGALPSINGGLIDVAGAEINYIEGILNGTTNYILTEMMNNNMSYQEALKTAQDLGIAELKPELDVEGYDTASKIIILANVILNSEISMNDVRITGITNVKSEELEKLKSKEKKLKLIGRIENKNGNIKAEVAPRVINKDHPLYLVDGKNKGIMYNTDSLGDITIIGGASGTVNAAASILRDIVNIK